MVKQRESLGQLDGNVSLNSTIKVDTETIQKCEHMQYQKCDSRSKCDFCDMKFKDLRDLRIHFFWKTIVLVSISSWVPLDIAETSTTSHKY